MPSAAGQVAPGAPHLIDLARPDSWPAPLRELIDTLAALTPGASHVSDLSTPDDGDERVRAVIAGAHLRAYHATRLLDHEREMITGQGLRAFSEDLFNDRIGAALAYDTISAEQHDTLLASHMYATGEAHTRGHREGQVCLILSDHTFDDEPSGVTPLLGAWGGEGIYFSKLGVHLPSALRRIGRPTIVVAAVPVLPHEARQPAFPELARLMVGAVRGLRLAGELHHPQPIPAAGVLQLWQPGDPEYDRFSRLPRT